MKDMAHIIFECSSSSWWGARLMYSSHELRNKCPFTCSPEKPFGDAGLIKHVWLAFEGCSQCKLGVGESGEHSDAVFKTLPGFDMLGSTLTQSRSACIANSCCRDWLIPAISLSSCLCQASVSSTAIGMLYWNVERKWREDRKIWPSHKEDFENVRNFCGPTDWLGQLATLSPPRRETFLL